MSAARLCVVASAALASAALNVSCAVGPTWRPPPRPLHADYSPTPLPTATSSAKVHGGEEERLISGRDIPFEWWELFQSPALDSLVRQAFKANPGVTAAQASLAQAHEQVYAQRGSYFPQLGATYQAERHKVSGNTNSSSTIGVQGNGLNKLPEVENPNALPHNLPSYYTFHTAELTVGFVPDVLGSNRRQVESLAAQADAQRFALEATYITLAANVVAAAIQEASLHAQLAATRQIIVANEELLRILREQFRLGYAMRIDVAAQEAALAAAQTRIPPLQSQLEQTRDLLRALLGHFPSDADQAIELDELRLPPELPVSLPAKIIEQRPDIRAAEAQLHAANAQVGIALAAMLPQLSISGQYGGGATEIPWMFRHGGPFWSIYGNVNQPLFQGGTLLHQKHAADAALKQAAGLYRSTVLIAYQNIADSLHACLSDADALAADLDAEDSAKVTYELRRKQLEAGYASYPTLLSAETAYEQALLTRIQAQAARYSDAVALFQALGGGWWNRQHEVTDR
jgi:NodT family efflux transporter outer membrane factor (OMF) lipoprotein